MLFVPIDVMVSMKGYCLVCPIDGILLQECKLLYLCFTPNLFV